MLSIQNFFLTWGLTGLHKKRVNHLPPSPSVPIIPNLSPLFFPFSSILDIRLYCDCTCRCHLNERDGVLCRNGISTKPSTNWSRKVHAKVW